MLACSYSTVHKISPIHLTRNKNSTLGFTIFFSKFKTFVFNIVEFPVCIVDTEMLKARRTVYTYNCRFINDEHHKGVVCIGWACQRTFKMNGMPLGREL